MVEKTVKKEVAKSDIAWLILGIILLMGGTYKSDWVAIIIGIFLLIISVRSYI